VWLSVVPRGQGTSPSFYRPRRGGLQSCCTILITCGGMAYNTVELMAVLANLCSRRTSWRVLFLLMSGFEGGCMGTSRLVFIRTLTRGCGLRMAVWCTTVGVVMSCRPGFPQRQGWLHRVRDGCTATEMAAQGRR
jgi:hypothetical protein